MQELKARLPPPWSVEEQAARFVVCDAGRAALMVTLLCYSAMRDTLIFSVRLSRPPTLLCE